MRRFAAHYLKILEEVAEGTEKRLLEIDLLSEAEKKQILFDFNNTDAVYPKNKTIHQFFEEQVERTPDHVAVVSGDKQLTYRELNEKANRLARLLRTQGIGPDKIAGLMIDRSLEMITGILGILKAGGACLPIDENLPASRLLHVLNDSGAQVLLTRERLIKHLQYTQLEGLSAQEDRIILTGIRKPFKNLDLLPIPDRSLIDYRRYHQLNTGWGSVQDGISLNGTRGCPYQCLYCHKIWPKSHAFRSGENLVEEIKQHYDNGLRTFYFVDDVFNLDLKNSTRFFELIIKSNMKLRLLFPNGLRGDLLTPDYTDLMVEAGVIQLLLALETASPRLQKVIKKNLNLERLRENIQYLCQRHPQVIIDLSFMFGFPTESEAEALRTLEFIKSIRWIPFPLSFCAKNIPQHRDGPLCHGEWRLPGINRSGKSPGLS